MISASQLLETAKKLDFDSPNKKGMIKPKQPFRFQLGSTETQTYLTLPFGMSDFDVDKDMKTLSLNLSEDLAKILNDFDTIIKKKTNKISKHDGFEWKSLVTQDGKYDARVNVKLYCKDTAPTRTRFYIWNGETKNDKPVLQSTTVKSICGGQKVVLQLSFGQVYTYLQSRGVTLYAKHVLIVDGGEEEEPDFL